MNFYYRYRESIIKIIVLLFILIIIYLVLLVMKSDLFIEYLNIELEKRFYNSFVISYASLNKNNITIDEIDTTIKDEENTSDEYNPIIYIYNTHETEKYKSEFKSDYSITPDVKLASYILKDYLNDYKIDSYIETKSTIDYVKKNNLSYSDTYNASRKYLKEIMKKYDFKILIDLHRDSISKTLTKDNKKYAKIMFVIGTNHKNYKNNLKLAESLNKYIEKNCKGISRGVLKKPNSKFNQDLNNNIILIEVGGIDNTLEEINNTIYILAKSINDYIKEGKND